MVLCLCAAHVFQLVFEIPAATPPPTSTIVFRSECAGLQVRVLDASTGPTLDDVLARFPHATVLAEVQPFAEDDESCASKPVGSLAWVDTTAQGRALLVGSETNDCLQLWHLDAGGLHARQTLRLVPHGADIPVSRCWFSVRLRCMYLRRGSGFLGPCCGDITVNRSARQ